MVTIRDIAELSGVSTATVSRILNKKGGASDATVSKVNAIVKKLGYQPNFVARTLSEQSSDLVALLVPDLGNPYFADLSGRIEQAADRRGLHIYLCNSRDERDKVNYYLRFMEGIRVRGAIISSLFVDEEDLTKLNNLGIFTLTMDRACFSHPYSALYVDHRAGGYKATRYLIQQGSCSHLMFISGPEQEKSSGDRYAGYLKAITEAGAKPVAKLTTSFSLAGGYQAAKGFLEDHPGSVDGIFCSDDILAIGAMRACTDLGIRIPQDMRVFGYDDIELAEYSVPRLSTVNQLPEDIGEQIMDLFESTVSSKGKPQKRSIEPHLVIRDSSQTRGA